MSGHIEISVQGLSNHMPTSGNDEVEATLAELAAVAKEMDALGMDRDIFMEAAALIRKLSAPVSNDEVETMCERLETNDDDVSYVEVVALIRKLQYERSKG